MAGYVMLIGAGFVIATNVRYFFWDLASEKKEITWLTASLPFIGIFVCYLFIKLAPYL